MKRKPKTPEELSKKVRKLVRDRAANGCVDLVRAEVLHQFTDDHLPCVDVLVSFVDGTTVFLELCWLDQVDIGAMAYADESPRARQRLAELLVERMDETEEMLKGERS